MTFPYRAENRGCKLDYCRECVALTHDKDIIDSCNDCFIYLKFLKNSHCARLQIIVKLDDYIHSFGNPEPAYMDKLREEFKRFAGTGKFSNGKFTDSGLYESGFGFPENVMEMIRKRARELGYLTSNEKDDYEEICRLME
jgi:hypothetical protein